MRIGHCLPIVLLVLFSVGCATIIHTPKDYELTAIIADIVGLVEKRAERVA